MASDEIENYERNPEPFSFITTCPTTWEQTIVPEAKIGEYVTIARKERGSSGRWFIGSITNEQPREMQLPSPFWIKESDIRLLSTEMEIRLIIVPTHTQ